ncbi:nicotinamide-nucleotide amidohydrolase family protein [Streptomyces sp. MJP52]|uniref:CinA family protein n=1 Tax=Streptomyces sp. MJP52 TaxID=2940555 RepID=UPI0024749091|nr:nicotinamide-nucleotide amidohydrolase family protein [Streptomyces sp. MJP52]MDH6224623.1 nicotinamide-nucleotide amidase [Streptomyces sp. MJP52]
MTSAAAEAVLMLTYREETVAVAESLTGGLVAAELTEVPGSSKAFVGSVTAYATELKHRLLGVDDRLLAEHGAVDARVARQMAEGVRRELGADWGIATTGVAGPEPQDGQPVGTVFVAVAGGATDGEDVSAGGKVRALRLNGTRAEIRMESVRSVLALLLEELLDAGGAGQADQQQGNERAQDTEQNGGI